MTFSPAPDEVAMVRWRLTHFGNRSARTMEQVMHACVSREGAALWAEELWSVPSGSRSVG